MDLKDLLKKGNGDLDCAVVGMHRSFAELLAQERKRSLQHRE